MIRMVMNNKWQWVWMEALCPNLNYHPEICLKGKMFTRNFSYDSWCSSKDLNLGQEYYHLSQLAWLVSTE